MIEPRRCMDFSPKTKSRLTRSSNIYFTVDQEDRKFELLLRPA